MLVLLGQLLLHVSLEAPQQVTNTLLQNPHLMTCSCFLGSCFSTSALRRRSRKGLSTLCSLSTVARLMVEPPSTMVVRGLENQSLNCAWLAKTCKASIRHLWGGAEGAFPGTAHEQRPHASCLHMGPGTQVLFQA